MKILSINSRVVASKLKQNWIKGLRLKNKVNFLGLSCFSKTDVVHGEDYLEVWGDRCGLFVKCGFINFVRLSGHEQKKGSSLIFLTS